ncbi:hypothetical protein KH5H1_59430 [Corallococcus caeni]|uniref:Uncharacterized protein n=1 Tax=Corallococcus caeni TaxID=3082388 RepID=A0ABQ6R2S8_9BACT|nr:hypothetical protein KH5H1_59430 [Corallococcus sp. KH5-1]GMU10615.1 hypothetical protein ASNO1_68690 [Corallococcus sp. NO1]
MDGPTGCPVPNGRVFSLPGPCCHEPGRNAASLDMALQLQKPGAYTPGFRKDPALSIGLMFYGRRD